MLFSCRKNVDCLECNSEPEFDPSAFIEWVDSMTFHYRGEKFTSLYGYNRYLQNKIVFENEAVDSVYWSIQMLLRVVTVKNDDGSVTYYDANPNATFRVDDDGYGCFFYKGQKYISRYYIDKNNRIVFEDEEVNNLYQWLSALPNFSMMLNPDGTVTLYEEFPLIIPKT